MTPLERIEDAAARLREDERVRALWLTGSLANGTGDDESDVDLRAAVRASDFASIGAGGASSSTASARSSGSGAGQRLPTRARRLMEANQIAYPRALEDATRRHLRVSLGLEFWSHSENAGGG